MKPFYVAILLCFSFTIQSSDQKIGHAFISDWKPGSYGSYTPSNKTNSPLPTWVWIQFDQKVTDEKANQFLDFLQQSLRVLDRSVYHQPIKNKPGTYCIVVQSFITKEQLQIFIDKANKQFDPTFKTAQEIAVLNIQADLQNKEAVFAEQQKAFGEEKRKFEESQRTIAEEKRKLDVEKNIIEAEKNRLMQEKIKQQQELERLKLIPTPEPIIQRPIVEAITVNTNISKINQNPNNQEPNLQIGNQQKITEFEIIAEQMRADFINKRIPIITNNFMNLIGDSRFNSERLQQIIEQDRLDMESDLLVLKAQYDLQRNNIPLNAYNKIAYDNKLRKFIEYTLPKITEWFAGLGGRNSSGLGNQIMQSGREIGLKDEDIESIIKNIFNS